MFYVLHPYECYLLALPRNSSTRSYPLISDRRGTKNTCYRLPPVPLYVLMVWWIGETCLHGSGV
jgi:hypothetical protein